jgi:hypothetical protein
VLFVHGTPDGADSSLSMGRFLVSAGFEVSAPSRPGYPGTPLAGGGAIDGQAGTDVPPDHSDHAAAAIPGAEKIVMDAGTHLSLFAHPDAASLQAQVVAKLR